MILLAGTAILLVVHLTLAITDRGNHERLFLSTNRGKSAYLDLLQDMEQAELQYIEMTQFIQGAHRRARLTATNVGFPVLVIVGGFGVSTIFGVPTWVGAIFPALFLAFQPAIERWQMIVFGNALLPEATRTQKWILNCGRILAAVIIWLALWESYAGTDNVRRLTGLDEWAAALVGATGLLAGLWLAYFATRHSGRVAQRFALTTGFEKHAGAETMLYLRSFNDDDLSIQSPVTDSQMRSLLWPSLSFEEYLSFCTKGTGLLVTVGRPGEGLPKPGAARAYYRPEDWQEGIRLTTQRAGRVILTTGATQALAWEISQLRAWGVLAKCLFLIPPLPPKQTDERLALLLTALEVPDSELTKARVVVGSSALVALRVQPDYTVVWFIAPARDWAAYLARNRRPGWRHGSRRLPSSSGTVWCRSLGS